jgi:tRNA-dihydrouridine synthase
VLGSGDCIEPAQIVERMGSGVSGVLVGRGVLRNPWILSQAADLAAGRAPREIALRERGQFLLDYIDLLVYERVGEADGFRHVAADDQPREARGRERWVINKLRALCAWYSKGFDSGSHLRVRVNSAISIGEMQEIVTNFFQGAASAGQLQK